MQIERARNQIIVGEADDLEARSSLPQRASTGSRLTRRTQPVRAEVKIRYRHEPAPATIYPLSEDRARIVFDEPQRAITPGQATIFYNGDEVVGGGWIVKE